MFKYNVFAMIYSMNWPINEDAIPFWNIVGGLYSIALSQFQNIKDNRTSLLVCITL